MQKLNCRSFNMLQWTHQIRRQRLEGKQWEWRVSKAIKNVTAGSLATYLEMKKKPCCFNINDNILVIWTDSFTSCNLYTTIWNVSFIFYSVAAQLCVDLQKSEKQSHTVMFLVVDVKCVPCIMHLSFMPTINPVVYFCCIYLLASLCRKHWDLFFNFMG